MTVKELAEHCSVSQQSIRNYCIKHNVPKEHNTRGQANFVIDEKTEKAIISHYEYKNRNIKPQINNQKPQENNTSSQENNARYQEKSASSQLLVNLLQQQLETLNDQLEIKDNQIKELITSLKAEQEHNKELTKQLETEKQLQAGNIKALLNLTEQHKSDVEILSEEKSNVETPKNNVPVQKQDEQQEEVKTKVTEPEPVKAEQEPTEQEEQPQKKQGFFAWLFKRK